MDRKIGNKFTKILCVLLTVLWMGFIFSMSAQTADDSKQTSSFFTDITAILFGVTEGEPGYDLLTNIIRKCAHAFEFGTLSVLSFLSVRHFSGNIKKCCVSAFVFSVLYAVTDEIHQLFVPGRACRFFDLCVDAAGIICGIVIMLLARKRK